MEQIYNDKMQAIGYNHIVCDIFSNWENVKDEILISDRKAGSGNGTIHVFLGAADSELRKEFANYYDSVKTEADAADGAIEITHYFLFNNIVSMLGYVCQYEYNNHHAIAPQIESTLEYLSTATVTNGLLSTKSLFKLSTGSAKLRPYFKQFDSNGVFVKLIRKILLPNSAYKISLYKNDNNEYAAFWLIGFDGFSNFEADSNSKRITSVNNEDRPHQIIFYGAPGTGKSHKIKEQLECVPKGNIFRTTFHPDSDYSTFVGAYKPTRGKRPLYGLFGDKTIRLHDKEDLDEDTITYEFIPQAFLNAYMQAYRKPDEEVYLIIEEINRGNCAQIFGDLFQLLDRDENGVSEYPIKADTDLKAFLEEELGEDSDAIKDGELCLPSNLYIYATMNTSDQSLFPIDSAFKRRWDWEYEPIKYKNTDWVIDIEGEKYYWTSFQKEVNQRILSNTNSEDKMLGDYFVNPKDGIITEKMLLNKILFYLWNDVCKDGEGDIFKTSETDEVSFSELYGEDGRQKLMDMMEYLKVEKVEEDDIEDPENENNEEDDDENEESSSGKDFTKYTINGEGKYPKRKVAAELVKRYIKQNPSMSAQEVVDKWKNLGYFVSHFIETQEEYDSRTDKPRIFEINCGEEKIYVSANGWGGQGVMDKLINAIPQDWNLKVEKIQ